MEIIKDILSKTKNDKLDPLSVIIKMFIYAYKPVGTKISIHNNRIFIQETGMFQGTVRTIYGDSKNDINIIFFPVVFACKYYLSDLNIQIHNQTQIHNQIQNQIQSQTENNNDNESINGESVNTHNENYTHTNKFIVLFEKLTEAFDKLKETYQSSEIIYNIDQLKNIVQSFLMNNDFELNGLASTYNSSAGKIKQDIYKHISTVWTEKRINVLFGYVDEIIELSANGSQTELVNNLVDSLHSYMNCIDYLVYNIVNTIN